MRVRQIEFFQVDLPLRFTFKHAAAKRKFSESIFVKLTSDSGVVGWGEALPRTYVTGESASSSLNVLRQDLAPVVLAETLNKPEDVYRLVGTLNGIQIKEELDGKVYFGAARCAMELALLDAASRQWNLPFSDWLGPVLRKRAFATAVVPDVGKKIPSLLWLIKLMSFKAIKVKVGTDHDEENLQIVRRILGPKVPLILDVNGAWQEEEAIEKLSRWRHFNIALVEQPVAPRNLNGMQKVREATGLAIMADESLRSMDDAENLINAKACSHFNIRVSKCGGLIASWKLLKRAQASGIRTQLGCQVGESSLLAAAGRWFALCAQGLDFYEGGYGTLLLKRDPARPAVRLGWRGVVRAQGRLEAAHVDEIQLRAFAQPSLVLTSS